MVSGTGLRPSWQTWLLLSPLLAWLIAFVVAPAAILLVYSFAQRDELGRVILTFSLDNYRRTFEPVYLGVFGRSIGYAAATTMICIVSRNVSPSNRPKVQQMNALIARAST